MYDTIVAAINGESKTGYTVLFDRLNNIMLNGQVAGAANTVTE